MTFIEKYLSESKELEYKNVWKNFKSNMRKAGFTAWEFEGDYETLIITFKDYKIALKAWKKYSEEINFLGKNSEVADGIITIELDDTAIKTMGSH